VPDPADRRRVNIEVTPKFYDQAGKIWGPLKADWDATLARRFTADQLERMIELLRATNEVGRKHLERLRR
jgi:DNA-binding MarR family transcriptional regulator